MEDETGEDSEEFLTTWGCINTSIDTCSRGLLILEEHDGPRQSALHVRMMKIPFFRAIVSYGTVYMLFISLCKVVILVYAFTYTT